VPEVTAIFAILQYSFFDGILKSSRMTPFIAIAS